MFAKRGEIALAPKEATAGSDKKPPKVAIDSLSVTLILLVWPVVAVYMIFVGLLALALVAWLWSAILSPVDLNWLKPVVAESVNSGWWKTVSIRVTEQSAWVMPSALATVVGICVAIYAVPRQDEVTVQRLVALAGVVAASTSIWAWVGIPSVWLSENPVPAIATFFVAGMVALLGGDATNFIRSPDVRVEILERRRKDLQARLAWLEARGWGQRRRPRPLIRILLWGFVPAIVVTIADFAVFRADNQGGLFTFIGFNFLIGLLAWTSGIAIAWPVPVGGGVLRSLLILGEVIGTAIGAGVPFLWAVRIALAFPTDPWVIVLSAVYISWSVAIVLSNAPFVQGAWGSRRRTSHGVPPPFRLARLFDWSLVTSVRDSRTRILTDLLNNIELAIAANTPAPVEPPVGALTRLIRRGRRRIGSDGA